MTEDEADEPIVLAGSVTEVLGDTRFRVKIDSGHVVLADLSDRMQDAGTRVIAGDRVTVELSPQDVTRGRIIYRP